MGGRGAAGRTTAALVAVLTGLAALAGPAVPPAAAAPVGTDESVAAARRDADALTTTTRSAQARARTAARRVGRLTREFEDRSRAAQEAADVLAAAFAVSADADRTREDDAERLRAAQVAHTARVRALYVEGGVAGLAMTVLTADDADEAVWRVGALDRIRADLLRRSSLDLGSAAARAARSTTAARDAEASDARLAVALRTVQDEAAAAAEALDRARSELARLDADAARTRAAARAARRLAAAEERARSQRLAQASVPGALGIPAQYEALYRAAAPSCPGMDWTLLAAVGQVESGHGRNNGPSSAGAIGPMQFMPATFAAYAVDGDSDGRTDAWDPDDAVWTAARYLCESGADEGTDDGVRKALFAYNRAQWYVDLVLGAQAAITRKAAAAPPR